MMSLFRDQFFLITTRHCHPPFFGVPNLSLSPTFLQRANQGVVNNGIHLDASRGTSCLGKTRGHPTGFLCDNGGEG